MTIGEMKNKYGLNDDTEIEFYIPTRNNSYDFKLDIELTENGLACCELVNISETEKENYISDIIRENITMASKMMVDCVKNYYND